MRKDGALVPVTWREALQTAVAGLQAALSNGGIAAAASARCTNEELYLLKGLAPGRVAVWPHSELLAQGLAANFPPAGIADIANAQLLILLDADPSQEQPLIDLWVKKAVTKHKAKLATIDQRELELDRFARSKLEGGAEMLEHAGRLAEEKDHIIIMIGAGAATGPAIADLLAHLRDFVSKRPDKVGVLFLAEQANSVGAVDLGLGAGNGAAGGGALFVLHSNPAAEESLRAELEKIPFVVYQGATLNETAHLAHVLLPGAAFAEKEGTFTNTERRVQRLRRGSELPGEARDDWTILRDLGQQLGLPWAFKCAAEVFKSLAQETPAYAGLDYAIIGLGGKRVPA